jgi:hypothetical protein
MTIARLAILLLALLPTAALAESRTFYDSDGRLSGRSISSGNATTYYGRDGKVTGRSTTSGNQTTIYGRDGRRIGTVTTKGR